MARRTKYYRTRKEQIEREIAPRCLRGLTATGWQPGRAAVVKKALRDAAMLGAAEERSRTLAILQQESLWPVADRIRERGVLTVLGYED